MNNMLMEINNKLVDVVNFINNLSRTQHLKGRFPEVNYNIRYWKVTDEQSYKLVTENKSIRYFDKFHSDNIIKVSLNEKVLKLNNLVKEYLDFYDPVKQNIDLVSDASGLFKDYYNRVGRFVFIEKAINDTVLSFHDHVVSTTYPAFVVYCFHNCTFTHKFSLQNTKYIRPIKYSDFSYYSIEGTIPFGEEKYLYESDYICTVNKDCRKDSYDDINNLGLEIDDLLKAIFLTKNGSLKYRILRKSSGSYFYQGITQISSPERRMGIGDKLYIDGNDIRNVKRRYELLMDTRLDLANTLINYPLNKSIHTANRNDNNDKLVDMVIAIEAMLAHDSPALESTYSFSRRGAAIIGNGFGTPKERIQLMKKLYGLRSRIVHGGQINEDINKYIEKLDRILRIIINWYIAQIQKGYQSKKLVGMIDEIMVRKF